MPDKVKGPSPYVNRQQAAELRDIPTQAHRAGEQHGKGEHLTGTELSRQAVEHSNIASAGHGIRAFGHQEIADLAYELWQSRGCPEGSPETDWIEAVHMLRARPIN